MNNEMEPLFNWLNNFTPTSKTQLEKVASKMNTRLSQGFSVEEAVDLLISEGEHLENVQKVAEYVYQELNKDDSVEVKTASSPVKYADVQDKIEELVKSLGGVEFVNVFASKNSLMDLSSKKRDQLEKLIWYARQRPEDRRVMADVHQLVQPYVEEAIQDSQVLARNAEQKSSFKFKKEAENIFRVKDDSKYYHVDIAHKTCTCPRYVLCSFNILNIPCEHLLVAAKEFDPNFKEEVIGTKKVYAQSYGNNQRFGWCDKLQSEIKIEQACVEANCPFMQQDCGDAVLCSF